MKNRVAYLYVFDTLADWEPGFIISELHSGRYFREGMQPLPVQTVASNRQPAMTKGGVRIIPDITIDEIVVNDAGLLILPGGDTWMDSRHKPVIQKAEEFLQSEVPVAAICGATVALANAGMLDNRRHTSNDLEYLKAVCPSYNGENNYIHEPAVADDNLITASGVAPLEFAREILKKLDVFSSATLSAWYQLYKTHKLQYFYSLMESLPKNSEGIGR